MCEGQSRRDHKLRPVWYHLRYPSLPDRTHLPLVRENLHFLTDEALSTL